jgi:hypothetical protein
MYLLRWMGSRPPKQKQIKKSSAPGRGVVYNKREERDETLSDIVVAVHGMQAMNCDGRERIDE